jgi:hypothetical protein
MDAVRKFNPLAGISLVATLLLGTETAGLQAQQGLALPATVLEAFAAQPDAKTAWSKFIGRLEGPAAYVIISAVALESGTSTPRLMRGIRIELRHEGRRPDCNQIYADWTILCQRELATVYVEESRLERLRTSVLAGAAAVHPGSPAGISSYRSGYGSGLIVFGYELQDRSPMEFAAMVAATQATLADAPR